MPHDTAKENLLALRDLLDEADRTPFGDIGKLLDNAATLCDAAIHALPAPAPAASGSMRSHPQSNVDEAAAANAAPAASGDEPHAYVSSTLTAFEPALNRVVTRCMACRRELS